jgi:methylated-DNA-[protein]-cysteine S-methyltransferase
VVSGTAARVSGGERCAAVLATRFGPLLVVVAEHAVGDRSCGAAGAVVDSGMHADIEPGLLVSVADHPLLAFAAQAVAEWESGGDLSALDRVPVRIEGDGFRERAWRALRSVPPGETVSYRELAAMAGNPQAMRAAGTACATNRLAPFVPCHRVIRSDGRLGEYGYSPRLKAALLAHEGVHQ